MQQMQHEPVPQRSALTWFILGIFMIPIIIYLYHNFNDMKKLANSVQMKTGRHIPTLSPGLAVIMMFIPILNLYVYMRKYSQLNEILNASGMPIQDRPMGGGMILLMILLSMLIIPIFILLWQFFKWQSVMNQAAAIANAS